jgi:AraC-like DNA-binding protein
MSRSAFAARFTELVGEPVMQYVTRWRMRVAVNALRDEGATVAQLADRLGYRSEAAFARAFKRVVGVAPGSVRREGRPATERSRCRRGSRLARPPGGRVAISLLAARSGRRVRPRRAAARRRVRRPPA